LQGWKKLVFLKKVLGLVVFLKVLKVVQVFRFCALKNTWHKITTQEEHTVYHFSCHRHQERAATVADASNQRKDVFTMAPMLRIWQDICGQELPEC